MREFEYVAITPQGKSANGTITAKNLKEAKSILDDEGLKPLNLVASKATNKKKNSKQNKKLASLSFSRSQITKGSQKGERLGLEFLKRLHELHSSGMPIAESVKLLNLRLSDPYQKDIAASLWKELAEGRTLSRAMRLLPQYFSESSTFVVEAGEATGNLAPILEKIIFHLEEKREIRSKVIGSMTYPIFVGLVAFGVVLFFLFFLLPQIQQMLDSLGGELNMMAKVLINGANLVLTLGPVVLIACFIAFGILYRWSKTDRGGVVFDQSLLRVPLFGEIFYLSELFQLSSLLSTLNWRGIGLTDNLRLCEKTIRNRFLRQQFRSARALVNEGKSLPDALRKFKFMPLMQLDVIEVGEKTGNLGNSMEDSSRSFRDHLTKRIKTMTTLVSGAALGFAFTLVALVAISIVTSIFQVSKSISY